ncbi:hypothetical protein [Cryobacterium sp. Y50]|nr:hypothetical protein [Cryobacterium sp. Y50]
MPRVPPAQTVIVVVSPASTTIKKQADVSYGSWQNQSVEKPLEA